MAEKCLSIFLKNSVWQRNNRIKIGFGILRLHKARTVHILSYKLELNLIFIDFVEDKVTIILGHHLNNIVLIEKKHAFHYST